MNEQQYNKWKSDTFNALVDSGVYTEQQALIIVDWFDGIKGSVEYSWFGDELLNALSNHWEGYPY